ncbi:histone deacetylase [Ruegeria sp. R13_0]|nr:histone deacetylase [Ruegeria sp. R13_0]MBO9433376.1 histone deacetylase [Ruegeria sp. R13_0]
MLRTQLLKDSILQEAQIAESLPASDASILRAHAAGFVAQFESGELEEKAIKRIGFPWSPELVLRVRATVGGAIAAAETALESGISGQLAGGTHHAHPTFGSGYCVYNDQAVAALHLLAVGKVERVAIVDLDVHQGDGSAAVFAENPSVFVFSMHGAKNFPFRKFPADLDVALPDGTGDEDYLRALTDHLPAVFEFRPDLILYQAGVDPLAEDKLGRLALTHDGLIQRDQAVLHACKGRGIPVSMAIGGGYADPIEASVKAYSNTYRVAKQLHRF